MNIRELLRKTQLLLIIACGTYPVLMIVIGRFAPELLPFGWLYAAAYLVLSPRFSGEHPHLLQERGSAQ